ncbi:MAG: hypothetical protein ACLQGP_34295 [Isosphaeraceae bacterium]
MDDDAHRERRVRRHPDRSNSQDPKTRGLAAVASPIPERFTNIRTSGLQVTLDREATRVDVDLKY